ncbi:hypothetical protein C8R45DRAFT_945869 [Mycena sanguinolenta]|nr:hypothetical protein C8R45DRAFT_945869 [Mycena sanguinolenta]
MKGLRTLEISVELEREELREFGIDGNPLEDAMRTLDTAPHSIEHLILNLNIWNLAHLSYFTDSILFEDLEKDRPGLQDVVVRIRSRNDDDLALQRGIQYLEAVFLAVPRKRDVDGRCCSSRFAWTMKNLP